MKKQKFALLLFFLVLALTVSAFSSCYPEYHGDGYRTTPLGSGTPAPVIPDSTPMDDVTTKPSPSDVTTAPVGDDTSTPSDEATSVPDVENTTAEDTGVVVVPEKYDFEIVTVNETIGTQGTKKSERILRYVRLTSLSDEGKQNDINELLSQIAEAEYRTRLPNAEEMIAAGNTIVYEILSTEITYMGNNILSVRSEGKIDSSDDSRDESFVYTNNINLSSEKDITLKKTYSDFASVLSLFRNGAFTQISGSTAYTDTAALTSISEQYKYHAQYGTFPESYFTKSELVVVIEVDREGGYFAEFSISLDKVNAFLMISPTK
jgi:hypothetical protein